MTKGLRRYRDEMYPSKELDLFQPNIDLFFTFMYKRQLIWHRRFVEHLPRELWTKDKVLKVTKYTNVYRQLDRGSLWAIHMIIMPIVNKCAKADCGDKEARCNFKDLIFKLVLYRMCCRIETFEKTGLPGYMDFDPVTYKKKLVAVSEEHSVMTNAYLTCPAPKGMTKIEAFLLSAIDCISKLDSVCDAILNAKEAKEVFEAILGIRGMGRFFAYEIYCDLCYSKMIPFTTNDFVNVGPGCNEGLRLLFPYVGSSLKMTNEKIWELFKDQNDHFERLGLNFRYCNWLEPVNCMLSMRSIEHSLCEFSKYWLQRHNLGKRRLDYTRWSEHVGFSIGKNGTDVVLDADTYEKYDELNYNSKHMASPTSKWAKFKSKIKSCSQQDIVDFVLGLR